jgi:ABC-type glycerol-3-phosphate transport system substrate-binding protein
MRQSVFSRRKALRALALAGGAGIGAAALAGCGETQIVEVIKEVPVEKVKEVIKEVPVVEEKVVVQEKIVTKIVEAMPKAKSAKLSFWMQEWQDGLNSMQGAIDTFQAANPNYTVELVPIGYADLFSKYYPAIVAGTSGEIVYSYTEWWSPIDVTKVLHPFTPELRSKSEFSGIFFPSTLDAVWSKDGERYVVPLISGCEGPFVTCNMELAAESGVDLEALNSEFESWEQFAEIDEKLRLYDGDKLTRAGTFSPPAMTGYWGPAMAWQLGAEWYNKAEEKWDWTEPETFEAFRFIADWYGGSVTRDIQTDGWPPLVKQRSVMHNVGIWTVSYYGGVAPDITVRPIVMPTFPGAKERIYKNSSIGSLTVPQFVKDEKKDAAFDFMVHVWQPENLAGFGNFYSGSHSVRAVYENEAYRSSKWGRFGSKLMPTKVWPFVKYSGQRVGVFEGNYVGKMIDEVAFDGLDLQEGIGRIQKDLSTINDEALARLKAGG